LQTIAYSRRASDVRTVPVWIINATATMDTEAKAAQCQVTRLIFTADVYFWHKVNGL